MVRAGEGGALLTGVLFIGSEISIASGDRLGCLLAVGLAIGEVVKEVVAKIPLEERVGLGLILSLSEEEDEP